MWYRVVALRQEDLNICSTVADYGHRYTCPHHTRCPRRFVEDLGPLLVAGSLNRCFFSDQVMIQRATLGPDWANNVNTMTI